MPVPEETGIEDSPADQLQKETMFQREKKTRVTNVLPALLRTHSPSPATSSPKTDRGRSRTSSQLPPSSFPAILGDSEFRLGLINSSRPRLPTVGSVPPDVHSCSQALVWSSYFRTPLPTPPRPTPAFSCSPPPSSNREK